jgi:hypothetical protein
VTRWPRAGQSGGKTAACAAGAACRVSVADLWCLRGVWPGVRRAGLPKAEPGADAGPRCRVAAPPCCYRHSVFRQPTRAATPGNRWRRATRITWSIRGACCMPSLTARGGKPRWPRLDAGQLAQVTPRPVGGLRDG